MPFRFRRRLFAMSIASVIGCLTSSPANGQCNLANAAFFFSRSGGWSDATQWEPQAVPSGGNVCLVNGKDTFPAETFLDTDALVANLQIGRNNTLDLLNGKTLYMLGPSSSIVNAGSIQLSGGGTGPYLSPYFGSPRTTLTLSGGGSISMAATNSATVGISGPELTLENVDNTIQGTGFIGFVEPNDMIFQNDSTGLVNANVQDVPLLLHPLAAVNQGRLMATGGGILDIQTVVNNSGGIISSDLLSQVVVGGTIQGGTLTGTVQLAGGSLDGATFGPLSLTGNLTTSNRQVAITGTVSLLATGPLTGQPSSLYIGSGPSTTLLSGGGTLALADTSHGGNAKIYGDGGAILENLNSTIAGEGQIGAEHGFILQNDAGATVNGNMNGENLVLNGVGDVINSGILEATGGGRLEIATGINNQGGTISTDSSSLILLDAGRVIHGGALQGNLQTSGSGGLLDGATQGQITNTGHITVTNGNQLGISGTLSNSGSLVLNAAGSATSLYLATLTGGGTITLADTTHTGNAIVSGIGAIIDNRNNTFQGEGLIDGSTGIVFNNEAQGILNANVAGQSLILSGGQFTNSGLMEATQRGRLEIRTFVNNAGGTITSDGASAVLLDNGSVIIGGTLSGNTQTNGDFMALDGGPSGPVINTGALTVNAGHQLITEGAVRNNGTLNMNGGTLQLLDGALTNNSQLQGFGVINGQGQFTNSSTGVVEALGGALDLSGAVVTNLSAGTLTGGAWWSGAASALKLPGDITTNAASIQLLGTDAQILDASGASALAGLTTNLGALFIGHGASVTVAGNFTQDDGSTTIQSGGGKITADNYYLNGGTLLVDGALDATSLKIGASGELSGSGLIDADVENGGSIAPEIGFAPLEIEGNLTQDASGFFEEEVGGVFDTGSLFDTGVATLDGTLDISFAEGYDPEIGDTFTILTASAIRGTFAHVNGAINGLEDFAVIYTGSAVEVRVEAAPEPDSVILLSGALLIGVGFAGKRRRRS